MGCRGGCPCTLQTWLHLSYQHTFSCRKHHCMHWLSRPVRVQSVALYTESTNRQKVVQARQHKSLAYLTCSSCHRSKCPSMVQRYCYQEDTITDLQIKAQTRHCLKAQHTHNTWDVERSRDIVSAAGMHSPPDCVANSGVWRAAGSHHC
jgi:hypothetical protein